MYYLPQINTNPFQGLNSIPDETILSSEQSLFSQNGNFFLKCTSNGTIVLFKTQQCQTQGATQYWQSDPINIHQRAVYQFRVQGDGNLVIYDSFNQPIWASDTWTKQPKKPYKLTLQNDGNLVFQNNSGQIIWEASKQQGYQTPQISTSQINYGQNYQYSQTQQQPQQQMHANQYPQTQQQQQQQYANQYPQTQQQPQQQQYAKEPQYTDAQLQEISQLQEHSQLQYYKQQQNLPQQQPQQQPYQQYQTQQQYQPQQQPQGPQQQYTPPQPQQPQYLQQSNYQQQPQYLQQPQQQPSNPLQYITQQYSNSYIQQHLQQNEQIIQNQIPVQQNGKNTLGNNCKLNNEQCLFSNNGLYYAKMQNDGKLCVYKTTQPNSEQNSIFQWQNNDQQHHDGPFNLVMQSDGNLVIYNSKGAAKWAHNKMNKKQPFTLVMQDDGNLVQFKANGKPHWGIYKTKYITPKQNQIQTYPYRQDQNFMMNLEGISKIEINKDMPKFKSFIQNIFNQLTPTRNLQQDHIVVKNISGGSGSNTYFVNLKDAQKEKFVMHTRNFERTDTLQEERTMLVQRAMSLQGLSPHRICSGKDWYLEPNHGKVQPLGKNEETVMLLGSFLARIHQTPIDWFESYKQKSIQVLPELRNAPIGHPSWMWACYITRFLKEMGPQTFSKLIHLPQTPFASLPGQRIVTNHGDFYYNNIVFDKQDNIYAIDFEWAYVGYATSDLAFALWKQIDQKRLHLRRLFIKSYLISMGDPHTPEDVDNLLLDAECEMLRQMHTSQLHDEVGKCHKNKNYNFEHYKKQIFFETQAKQNNQQLRQLVLEVGIFEAFKRPIVQTIIFQRHNLQFKLNEGETLQQDQALFSPSGTYFAYLRGDGQLIIYKAKIQNSGQDATPIWSNNICQNDFKGPIYLIMQQDGNLVIYNSSNKPIWASGTHTPAYNGQTGPYSLQMQDDSNLVIYDKQKKPKWAQF